MVGGLVASIGGAIFGGGSGSKASNAQVQASLEAQRIATAEQRRQYDQTRSDSMPWMTAGGGAVTRLGDLLKAGGELDKNFTLADFQADPGYNFRMQEGMKALDRSASARGRVLGGAQLKDITRYGSDFASNEYNNAYNRFQSDRQTKYNMLAGLSGLGQTSANTVASAGANAANQIGNYAIRTGENVGNARAAGYANWGNQINSGIGNAMNWYLLNQQNG